MKDGHNAHLPHLFVKVPAASSGEDLRGLEPLWVSKLRHRRASDGGLPVQRMAGHNLRNVITDLHWHNGSQHGRLFASPSEDPWPWAHKRKDAGEYPFLSEEELVVLRLCSLRGASENVLKPLGHALWELEVEAATASEHPKPGSSCSLQHQQQLHQHQHQHQHHQPQQPATKARPQQQQQHQHQQQHQAQSQAGDQWQRSHSSSSFLGLNVGLGGGGNSSRDSETATAVRGLWRCVAKDLISGIAQMSYNQEESAPKLFCKLRMSRAVWDQHFSNRNGGPISFLSPLLATAKAPKLGPAQAPEGSEEMMDCIVELDATVAQQAAYLGSFREESDEGEAMWLVPPYVTGFVRGLEVERYAGPFSCDFLRVRLEGLRTMPSLPGVVEATEDQILQGALLVGLHATVPPKPQLSSQNGDAAGGGPVSTEPFESSLLQDLGDCFRNLAVAAAVKNVDAVEVMWKGYIECLLQDVQSWQRLKEAKLGLVGVARTAVVDVALAARNVTMRSLGFESAMNIQAMEEERHRRAKEYEELKKDAVSVAREQVSALGLETLTDPEGFLKFLQHDPLAALEAVPAALCAYVDAEPAQRVFLFAKMMGLAAMAGGLLRGDQKVAAAFDSPFPLEPLESTEHRSSSSSKSASPSAGKEQMEAARRAVTLLDQQRLSLSRTRLLVAGGAPDVGKTTILREVFGFDHFRAGLSQMGQTDQITFALHPDGDEHARPVYVVDTPGFGDGEQVYRNDMLRLLQGAGDWIPGGLTLLWVLKAGRNIRQPADEMLRSIAQKHDVRCLVIVTHVDKLFEERYREVGPQWKDSILNGVPHKDPRWPAQRQTLMTSLKEEIDVGVRSVLGDNVIEGLRYACLGGWMVGEADEEDEFAQPPPWPWARKEVTDFFNVLDKRELRSWLDASLGL